MLKVRKKVNWLTLFSVLLCDSDVIGLDFIEIDEENNFDDQSNSVVLSEPDIEGLNEVFVEEMVDLVERVVSVE